MRIDLSDVSLVASLQVDGDDRRRNLERYLDYYGTIGEGVEVVLVEQRPRPDAPVADLSGHGFVRHVVLDGPEVHWATRNRNLGARLASRPVLALVDVDVLVLPEAFEAARARLAAGADFVQLFDGILVDVEPDYQARHPGWPDFLANLVHFERDHDRRPPRRTPGLAPLYGGSRYLATGGATACRREAFLRIGGWNENFVSYGFEDDELAYRIDALGHGFERLDGVNAYHLHHERGPDSYYNQFYRSNEAELGRVKAMAPDELRRYAERGFRAIELRHDREYAFTNEPTETSWRRVDTGRADLSDVCLIVTVDASIVSYERSALPALLRHLERAFRFAEVRLCEVGPGGFELIDTKNDVIYAKRPSGEATPAGLAAEAARATRRPWVLPVPLSGDAAADHQRVRLVLDALATGARPVDGLEAREAFLRPAAAGTAPRSAGGAPPAIYVAFDDGFLEMAGACLASLAKHWPDHPTVLVDYVGDNAAVRDWIAAQPRMEPAPVPGPPLFARVLGSGPVGSEMVHRRFALWTPAFDAWGPILHLDADTLVMKPLDDLVEGDAWTILPNHEATPYVRVFDPIFQHDVALADLLAEDGLDFPHGMDDLANAGVFLLPRALRSDAQLAALERIATRYARYLAYADQSVISLWCLMQGLPYSRDWRDNYQTVFVLDPSVPLRADEARVLHFSSHYKPGDPDFETWERVGAHGPALARLHREFVEVSDLARLGRAAG